jgi:hypothetical protein
MRSFRIRSRLAQSIGDIWYVYGLTKLAEDGRKEAVSRLLTCVAAAGRALPSRGSFWSRVGHGGMRFLLASWCSRVVDPPATGVASCVPAYGAHRTRRSPAIDDAPPPAGSPAPALAWEARKRRGTKRPRTRSFPSRLPSPLLIFCASFPGGLQCCCFGASSSILSPFSPLPPPPGREGCIATERISPPRAMWANFSNSTCYYFSPSLSADCPGIWYASSASFPLLSDIVVVDLGLLIYLLAA